MSASIALLISQSHTQAAVIYQSALPGGYGATSGSTIGGYSGSGQILGAAFSVTQSVHVDSIGGLFFSSPSNGPNDIFGAIVRLSNVGALPIGNPFSASEVLGSVVFSVGSETATDVYAPLSLDLVAGDYAVVFGSGYFGATGIAAAPGAGGDLSARYIYWGDGFPGGTSWRDGGHTSERFVVLGTVPEPASATFVFVAALITLGRRSVQRANKMPNKTLHPTAGNAPV